MTESSSPARSTGGRCPDSRHCAPIERFRRRTGLCRPLPARYAWVHIGPIGLRESVVSIHWSDETRPLESRLMPTLRRHASYPGCSVDVLGLDEPPHDHARPMRFMIDGRPLTLFVVAQFAWREQDGIFAGWFAHPSGNRIDRVSDEHVLTRNERVLMMQLEDLLLGHTRAGRKPRDADAIDAAEVDVWLAARRETPQPRWRDLADRYHRNADTIRKRCHERELELARERTDTARSSLSSEVLDYVERVRAGAPDATWFTRFHRGG